MTRQPTLEIKGLSVDYLLEAGDHQAVKNVSFEIQRQEIFGLAGESGCGKSTIAFAIMRLLRMPAFIRGGEILLDGADLLRLAEEPMRKIRWRRIGMVFQSAMNSLNPVMRIEAQFRDVLMEHTGCDRHAARARAEEMMKLVDIPPARLDDYPHQFSGGMRQRIVIAICMALQPNLIIMDEPTTALDVVVQREILKQIFDLQRQFGFSILFITHDLHLMAQFCHRIGIMQSGELVEVGLADEIAHRAQHPYTRRLWSAFPSLPHRKAAGAAS